MRPVVSAASLQARCFLTFSRYALYLTLTISLSSCLIDPEEPGPPPHPDPLPPPTSITVDTSPVWSPDGARIAYYRLFPSSNGPPGIYLVQDDGTNNRLLFESPTWTRDLRFSPDGTRLSMTLGLEVFILTIQDQTLRQLTTTDGNAQWADWSPDGNFVVISGPLRRYPGDGGLHIIDVATGAARGLDYNGGRVYGATPRWSPTSEVIAFSSSPDNRGYEEIFTIRTEGTDLRRITNTAAENALADDPRWMFGGTHFLYRWTSREGTRSVQTRMIRSDGSDSNTLPFEVYYYDAISPDSRQVATTAKQRDSTYTIEGLPIRVLFIRDLDDASGASLRQITSYAPPPAHPDIPTLTLTARGHGGPHR